MINERLKAMADQHLDKMEHLFINKLNGKPKKNGRFDTNLIKELNHDTNDIRGDAKVFDEILGSDECNAYSVDEKEKAYDYFKGKLDIGISNFSRDYLKD